VTTRQPAPDKVDLNKVVFEVLGDLEDQVTRTKGRVDVGKLPTVLADPTHMQQLFQNLISNALKFHRDGVSPIVTISARSCEDPDCRDYKITVVDNGIGFDQKYVDRIFGVFQRLHGRDSYEGTGIGLAVCRKIVEQYGGTITAESQKGEGAKFTIKIPVAEKEKKSDD
jgi:light-regulated signal transduction histidine kinase (bacteriophytochrome)